MPIATLVRFPDKRVRVTEKGSKRERTRGGSESIGTRISAGRSGKGRGGDSAVTGVKPKVRYTRGKVAPRRAVSTPIGRREIRANEQRPVERETPSRTVVRTDTARHPNLRYRTTHFVN